MTCKAPKTSPPFPRSCCLGPFWQLRAVGALGYFFSLFFLFLCFCFSFFLKIFISITAPAQTFKFLWVFLWIFPRTGEFGGRNRGNVVASPTLPISSTPEDQEETSPCVFWRKIPLLHPTRWSQYSKQPFSNSAALSMAQDGIWRDWQGLVGKRPS